MENAQKFIKTYEALSEQSFKKWGYYYPPKTWEAFESRINKHYNKYLKDDNNNKKRAQNYIRLAGKINDFAFYDLYQNFDFEYLNNILFQTSRQKLLHRGMLGSGRDHSNVLFNALSSFSCNDFSVIDYCFPKNLPQSKGQFYTEVSVNILKVMYYNQEEYRNEAIAKSEKFLSKKISSWERHTVLYLKALLNKNANEASTCLQQLCTAYQKMTHSVDSLSNKLAKYFAYEIHGLYRFARIIDKDFFESIQQPKHHCFLNSFEQWQKENDYPKGKLFYVYPREMDFINKMFNAELPTVELFDHYPERKKVVQFKNHEKFILDLIHNIEK